MLKSNGLIFIKKAKIEMRYAKFCSKVIFPIQEALKGHSTVHWRKFLEESQWWTQEKLALYTENKLNQFLSYASESIPFYRDITNFPLMTKQMIRENFHLLQPTKKKVCHLQRTGGSTGEPLYFLISKNRVAHDVAAKWRVTRWFDVDIGDREIVFWGSPIEVTRQSIARQLRDILFRSHLIPARNLDHGILEHIVKSMLKNPPKMLFGYPSLLTLLARFAEKHHYKMHHLGIKVAFVTSEVLDHNQRQIIQDVFGCRVANGYGGRESGFIAHECPYQAMHITMEDIHVEIVNAQGAVAKSGELGEVVVTHFETQDFPFIRYRTGDYAILSDTNCKCGRQLKTLSHLEGRQSDLIFSTSGAVVHRAQIVTLITEIRNIEQFQVIQESLQQLRICIKGKNISTYSQATVVQGLKKLLGADVEILIEFVDHFQAEPSGKFKFVTSKVAMGMV